MKKLKILGTILLIPIVTIGTIGLASCSGATVTPPVVEPPKPEVIPPTPIYKPVTLIKPLPYGKWEWAIYEVDKVEYVKLIESTFPSAPSKECLEYSIKLKNNEIQTLWTTDIEVIKSYNNWLEVSNERNINN